MILTLLLLLTGRDVHLFVDEFVVNDSEDLKTLDAILEKIDLKNHVWITVAKASETHRYDFEDWLEKKIKEGYREPSLKYPLRNTKEIIKFEKSLLNPLQPEQNNVDASMQNSLSTSSQFENCEVSSALIGSLCTVFNEKFVLSWFISEQFSNITISSLSLNPCLSNRVWLTLDSVVFTKFPVKSLRKFDGVEIFSL